jgi:hypothetical protein
MPDFSNPHPAYECYVQPRICPENLKTVFVFCQPLQLIKPKHNNLVHLYFMFGLKFKRPFFWPFLKNSFLGISFIFLCTIIGQIVSGQNIRRAYGLSITLAGISNSKKKYPISRFPKLSSPIQIPS